MIPSQQTQYFTFKLIWAKKSSFSQCRSLIRLDRKRPVKISSSSFPGAQEKATLHAHTWKQAFQTSVMYQYTSPTMKDTAPFSPVLFTQGFSLPQMFSMLSDSYLPAPKMTRRSTPDSYWCSWGIRNLHSILPVFPIIQELWHSTLWRVRTSFRSQGCLVESKHLAKGRSESGFVATFHLQSSVHLRRCPHEILRTDSSFVLWSTAPKAKCMPITKAEKGSDNLTSYQDSVKINTYQALQVLSA